MYVKVCADPGPCHLQRGASRQLPRLRGGGEARGVAAELQRAAPGGPGEDSLCQVWPLSSLLCQVWPDDDTFFPDWTSPVTQQWWVDQITAFHDQLQFDGLWIDMNEPANFVAGSVQGCANNSLNFPPYKPGTEGADLLQKTVCLDAVQEAGLHYDLHSLYGWTETEPTLRGARLATGGRSLVLSRYNMWIIQK